MYRFQVLPIFVCVILALAPLNTSDADVVTFASEQLLNPGANLFDINGDNDADFIINNWLTHVSFDGIAGAPNTATRFAVDMYYSLINYPANAWISSKSAHMFFASGFPELLPGETYHFGFRLETITGDSENYGYLKIGNSGGNFVVYRGAFETQSGSGISAGAIPEPSGMLALPFLAIGLTCLRRRRK